EQAGGEDLEVLEVDPGAAFLRRLEGAGVEADQVGEMAGGETAVAGLGGAGDRRLERLAEGREGSGFAGRAERFERGEGRWRPGGRQAGERLLEREAFGVALLQLLK